MIIISVDLGLVRTGLAICDKSEILAFPLSLIVEKNREILAKKVAELAFSRKAQLIIVGLPKNMDGTFGESSKNANVFCKTLKRYTDLEIKLWDERLTTVSASANLNETNTRGKKRKNIIDTVSATIILQNYLDYRKNTKRKD